jgi:hypothetical protein
MPIQIQNDKVTLKSLVGTSNKPTTISSSDSFTSSAGKLVYCYLVEEDGEYILKAIIY